MTATAKEPITTDSPQELSLGIDDTKDIEGNLELKEEIPEETTQDLYLNMEPLKLLADHKTIRVPRNPHFSRKDVVQSFQSAFELIGGVPRLALWANEHTTEFYKLYSRLLPSQASSALGESNVLRIEMAIKPGPLDEVV